MKTITIAIIIVVAIYINHVSDKNFLGWSITNGNNVNQTSANNDTIMVYIYPTPPPQAGCHTRSVFKSNSFEFTLGGSSLKLVDKFTYLGSCVPSTEKDIDTRLAKARTAINRLLVIWKTDLTDKMKCSFFQALVMSVLLYGYTTWTLTKSMKKMLDGNNTKILQAILNKSWRQHLTKQ